MYLSDTVIIDRAPEVVWRIVGDPTCIVLWNPRLVDVRQMLTEERRIGTRYQCVYEWKGKRKTLLAAMTEYDPPRRMVLRMQGDGFSWNTEITETYTLTPVGAGTRVLQEIHITNSGVPWYLRALVWCIQKFGKPTGTPYLQTLKTIVEELA